MLHKVTWSKNKARALGGAHGRRALEERHGTGKSTGVDTSTGNQDTVSKDKPKDFEPGGPLE